MNHLVFQYIQDLPADPSFDEQQERSHAVHVSSTIDLAQLEGHAKVRHLGMAVGIHLHNILYVHIYVRCICI